jgi:hypothetical protein
VGDVQSIKSSVPAAHYMSRIIASSILFSPEFPVVVMKKQHLCILVLASSFSFTRSLPLRTTRGGGTGSSDSDNDHGHNHGQQQALVLDAVVDGNEVLVQTEPSLTTPPNRLEFVENFFGGMLTSFDLQQEIHARATNMTDFLVQTRRTLHRHPELMYQEEQTSRIIQKVLSNLNVSFTTGWARNAHPNDIPGTGGYGIVADIGTGQPPCVLLRADMDALPILERTVGIDTYKSINAGAMHACGHDGHTTMLLGATAMLKQMEHSLNGTIRVMFQPAEEGGAGAKRMREEGVLDMEPKPQYAFG